MLTNYKVITEVNKKILKNKINKFKQDTSLRYPQIFHKSKIKDCKQIKNKFVIHEHHAIRAGLHYDIRLEIDCKLKSFATRNLLDILNLDTNKIQVFNTPDHDMTWFDFAGTIPQPEYGAGIVKIFDTGKYKLIKNEDNKIVVDFKGERIKGKFAFIKLPNESWLFIKMKGK